jgi:two-component system, OmpR family, sensor histidine kinase CiaH
MFRKLKIKLTLLNLLVAGVILLGISAASFLLIADNIKSQSEQSFQMLVDNFTIEQNQNGQLGPITVMGMGIMANLDSFYFVSLNQDELPEKQLNINSPMDSDIINKVIELVLQDQEAGNLTIQAPGKQTTSSQISGNQFFDIQAPDVEITPSQNDSVKQIKYKTIDFGNGEVCRYTAISNGDNIYVVIQNLRQERTLLTNVGIVLGICVFGGLLLLSLGGLFLAERSLRPIRLSWQKQRDFIADASHELRTPLAAISSNIDVVMDDPEATVREKQLYCQGIAEETKRMSYLVDNLLMLARADSDVVIFQDDSVDIAEVAKSAVDLMLPVADKKDIALNLQIYAAPVVSGDADRLKQVLLQLLDNAVKYIPDKGKVDIKVDDERDRAIIEVSDNGIGIALEHLEKIFERFYRVDASREHEVGGHGLGLAIVKFIVESHGGTVDASSTEGAGSKFTVTLPIKEIKHQ